MDIHKAGHKVGLFLLLSVLGHGVLFAWLAVRVPLPPSDQGGVATNRPLVLTLALPMPSDGTSAASMRVPARRAAADGKRRIVVAAPTRPAIAGDAAPESEVRVGATAVRAAVDAFMRQEREAAERGQTGRLPPALPAQEKSPFQQSLEAHARPDCWHAYSALGLMAIVPLALDAATDRGCRW